MQPHVPLRQDGRRKGGMRRKNAGIEKDPLRHRPPFPHADAQDKSVPISQKASPSDARQSMRTRHRRSARRKTVMPRPHTQPAGEAPSSDGLRKRLPAASSPAEAGNANRSAYGVHDGNRRERRCGREGPDPPVLTESRSQSIRQLCERHTNQGFCKSRLL